MAIEASGIPSNVIPPNFNFVDALAKQVAEYLMEKVNDTFLAATNGNKVIKTYRTFNDYFIPLTDLPCLKIYRNSQSSYFLNSQVATCDFTLNYIIAANRKRVSDINIYVTEEILRLLINSAFEEVCFSLSDTTPLQVTYEDFINPDNTVLQYSIIKFSLFNNLGTYFECS